MVSIHSKTHCIDTVVFSIILWIFTVNFQEIINLWIMVNVIESMVGHLTSLNTWFQGLNKHDKQQNQRFLFRKLTYSKYHWLTLWDLEPSMLTTNPTPQASLSRVGSYRPWGWGSPGNCPSIVDISSLTDLMGIDCCSTCYKRKRTESQYNATAIA